MLLTNHLKTKIHCVARPRLSSSMVQSYIVQHIVHHCVVPQGTNVASKYEVMTSCDVMAWRHDVTWRHIMNFWAKGLECTWCMMLKRCECCGIFITRYYWCNTLIILMWRPFWINLYKLTSHWLMKTLAHHGINILYRVVQSMLFLPLFLHGQWLWNFHDFSVFWLVPFRGPNLELWNSLLPQCYQSCIHTRN